MMAADTAMHTAHATEGFRASAQQLRAWHDQAALLHVELPASIEARALRRALQSAVERHEILRTRLRTLPGMDLPLQVIAEGAEIVAWDIVAEGDAPNLVQERAAALAEQMGQCLADASQPVLASGLIRSTCAPSRWLLALPAACTDRKSMYLLAHEVARSLNGTSPVDEVLQYADFAEWQHEMRQGAAGDAGSAFWKRQIDRAALQTRHPFERRIAGKGRVMRERGLDRAQTDRLLTAAGGQEASVANLMFVCWAALLQRQLGTPGVVVAWQHDGRNELACKALGPYAKRLPLHVDQLPTQTLEEWVRAQESRLAEADAVQDSFVASDAGFDGPWPHGFHFEDRPALPEGWRLIELRMPLEQVTLDLRVRHQGDGVVLALDADAKCFDAQALDVLLDQLTTLTCGACELAHRPLQSTGCLSEMQRRRLQALQQPTADIESPPLLHQLFEHQVRQRPQAIALEFGSQQLSYGELNARANRIAHRLRRAGLQPEQAVGLFLERSIEAMVGLLGTLKAGGAYLPLDPAYPQDRLAHMLQDSAATLVLTLHSLRHTLPISTAHVLLMDEDSDDDSDDDPTSVNHPDQLAYLIYTSGSTGQPKGVMVSHRNAVHSTTVRRPAYEQPCESFLLLSSISFDSSVAGLFWALSQGGRLCLPTDAQVLDLKVLAGLIATHGISHTLMLPSLYGQLLEAETVQGQSADRLGSLVCVIVAGEAAAPALAARHRAACPQARLYNEYGPTEGSVWCTLYRSHGEEQGGVLPIGYAIPNMRVQVVDGDLDLLPPGVAGEIAIGGAGIARGYLHRAALTAERFIPDPHGAPGDRLYRTGDIGCCDADGCLAFLGRTDHQVKIRGHRIELGEIEAALLAQPQVREAAVVARRPAAEGGAPAELRLVAYIVARVALPTPELLRDQLKRSLPEYMLPAAFVVLDALPLTPNGKLDRSALPEPQPGRRAYEAPRNEAEALLAQIWSEVLGVDPVGLNDDFFKLGGHSLLATQLVSRVRAGLQREVPVRTVFQHPRLADFAQQVMGAANAGLPPLVPTPRDGPFPLSFAQQRLWFFDRLHPHSTVYNVADTVRLRGPLALVALQRSIDALVARHESLRTRFASTAQQPVQLIDAPRSVPMPLVDLAGVPQEQRDAAVRRWLDAEAAAPFHLSEGPLLRMGVLRLGDHEHVLWLTMHHIVCDGWSMRVLVRELTVFYEAFCEGREPVLPALPIQVADHAQWQHRAALSDAWREQLDFWRHHVGPLPRPLKLPGMRARPALQSHRGAQVVVTIDAVLLQRIDIVCREQVATRFMVLLAVFKVLLATAAAEPDIRVGVPIANRHRLEFEGLIGFFVNSLALRTQVVPRASFVTLLRQVREGVLAAQANQDLPFEQLVDELQPTRDPGCSPLFQVMFDLHRGHVLSQDRIGDLTVERMPGATARTTMFDLMLDITEAEDGLNAIFTYAVDLFAPDAVPRLAQDYVSLIQAALHRPEEELQALTQGLATPVTTGEPEPAEDAAAQVLDAAQAVLGIARVDANVSFFEQGGSSLRALAWIERLNRCWSVRIPLHLVFLHPTIADFIAAVRPYAGECA